MLGNVNKLTRIQKHAYFPSFCPLLHLFYSSYIHSVLPDVDPPRLPENKFHNFIFHDLYNLLRNIGPSWDSNPGLSYAR